MGTINGIKAIDSKIPANGIAQTKPRREPSNSAAVARLGSNASIKNRLFRRKRFIANFWLINVWQSSRLFNLKYLAYLRQVFEIEPP